MSIRILMLFSFIVCIKCELKQYSFGIRTVVGDPDGYRRPVIIVYYNNNTEPLWDRQRPFPAPLIRATNGDELEVSFTNFLYDQSTSIHFHGLHMLNNPWMDGVHMITQCPILPGQTFTYKFNLTQSGTFWYHSHSHQQYADGLIGPIVIDPKPGEEDPIRERYPYDDNSDYTVILQEWYHETWQDIMIGYRSFFNSSYNYRPRYPWPPTSVLINGHGSFDCHTTNCLSAASPSELNACNESIQCIPLRESYFGECSAVAYNLDEFLCHNEKYVRLRLINAASGAPLRFWIDQHPLVIVARDSLPVEPYEKPYIAIPVGQRLDVIVRCDQNPTFKYNMYVNLPANFVAGVNPNNSMKALFVYPHSKTIIPSHIPPDSNFTDDVLFEYKNLKPLNAANQTSPPAVKRLTYYFSVIYDNTLIDSLEEWQINNKTFISPSPQPLLQAIYFEKNISRALPTPRIGHLGNSHETYVEFLEFGKIYEVLIVSNDSQQHPFHLHGYTVDFVAAGTYKNLTDIYYDECNFTQFDTTKIDYDRVLPLVNESAEILSKGDSFTVPKKGFVLFRFRANNPGPWFFHCHMEWHISPGLGVVFSVGIKENNLYDTLFNEPLVKEFLVCGSTKKQWNNIYPTTSSMLSLSPSKAVILMLLGYFMYH